MLSIPADSELGVALVSAIQRGDVDALQAQLRQHPELAAARVIDERGVSRTLLHVAADWPGHFPTPLRRSLSLRRPGRTSTPPSSLRSLPKPPLHWAASYDDVEVLDALLDADGDIEAPGAVFTGGTPMCRRGCLRSMACRSPAPRAWGDNDHLAGGGARARRPGSRVLLHRAAAVAGGSPTRYGMRATAHSRPLRNSCSTKGRT